LTRLLLILLFPLGAAGSMGASESICWENEQIGIFLRQLVKDRGILGSRAKMTHGGDVIPHNTAWEELTEKLPYSVSFVPAMLHPTCQRVLTGHQGVILAVAPGRQGRISSGGWDGTARRWQALVPHREQTRAKQQARRMDREALLGTIQQAAALHVDQEVRRLFAQASLGANLATYTCGMGTVASLAALPDGRLVTGGYGSEIKVWPELALTTAVCESKSTLPVLTLIGHGGSVRCLLVVPPNNTIASGSDDRTIRLWDAATGEATACLSGHDGAVTCLAHLGWTTLVSGSEDGTVRLWDYEGSSSAGGGLAVMRGHEDGVCCVAKLNPRNWREVLQLPPLASICLHLPPFTSIYLHLPPVTSHLAPFRLH